MTNFWKNTPVLVTGATGFIASHLVESLLSSGANVRVLVRTNSQNDLGSLSLADEDIVSSTQIMYGDLRDLAAVQQAAEGMDYIFHLGALVSIPYSYMNPTEVAITNILGTLNVLQSARDHRVKRLIHTSTSEVYGSALRVPIDETHPLQAQSPYSASKIGADKLAESFFNSFDLPVVTLRPFNTYGPRQSARAVIPTIITQALTQDVVYLGNLDAKRDLTYVDDTVSGFLKVAEAQDVEGKVYNLGFGKEVSIGDLAKDIVAIISKPIEIVTQSERIRPKKSEVDRLLSDNSLARKELGWEPKISLEKGLQKTIKWIKKNLEQYRPESYQT